MNGEHGRPFGEVCSPGVAMVERVAVDPAPALVCRKEARGCRLIAAHHQGVQPRVMTPWQPEAPRRCRFRQGGSRPQRLSELRSAPTSALWPRAKMRHQCGATQRQCRDDGLNRHATARACRSACGWRCTSRRARHPSRFELVSPRHASAPPRLMPKPRAFGGDCGWRLGV